MARHTIGLETVGRFRKQGVHLRLAAGTGYSGFRIGNQVCYIHQTGLDQGKESQLNRCRVTTGVGYKPS